MTVNVKYFTWCCLTVLICVQCCFGSDSDKQNVINLRAKQITQPDVSWPRFEGNKSTEHLEYFTVLQLDGDYVLLGARDVVYNLSVHSLQLQQRLVWHSSKEDILECVRKGKSNADCHNYIRIMADQSAGRTLVCGTNAYKPTCRQYSQSVQLQHGVHGYQMLRQFDGFAIAPFHPRHNSTALLVPDAEGDSIYAGTVTDFGGTDNLVYRRTLDFNSNAAMGELRTRRDDHANFVSSISRGEYVYMFFRETAVEQHSTGQIIYSRVARLCRRDQGGRSPFSDSWTSFVKARISCKLPDDQPFMFDQLQSLSPVVHEQSDGSALVYGVFTSSENALRMSAVCAYRLNDIDQVFDHGAFLATPQDVHAPWLPVLNSQLPQPRPAKCVPNSRLLSDETVNFVQRNMIMADNVPQRYPAPLMIDNTMKGVYTCVGVSPAVRAVNGQLYDVVYLGTSDGRLHKLLRTSTGQSVLIETTQVFDHAVHIKQLIVHQHTVLVVTNQQVRALPTSRCGMQNTCAGCVRLHDPQCAWHSTQSTCVDIHAHKVPLDVLTQSVDSGRSPLCPEGDYDPAMYAVDDAYGVSHQQRSLSEPVSVADSGNVAVAVVLTLAIASTLGFLVGYRVSVWKQQQQAHTSAGSSTISSCDYDSSSLTRARLTRTTNQLIDPTHPKLAPLPGLLQGTSSANVYASPPSCTRLPHGDPLANIKLQHVHGGLHSPGALMTGSMTLSRTPTLRTANSLQLAAAVANGTLPRDYKVKRAYV